ncbi:uncharacterized protein B0I36DRAFT_330072 [Microdochium trichocladiopsis]|uniref:25S rRNA (Uridine(2843)-N(3))-methyltransferase n=1 Tax=Microdochium trichocladiopsis TaxID=1682393 RepID=A0A9P8XYS8_9PEZI|nr:uncharacterized protein B0I36DRAFT_330072 [Microdochium trichocladiopsis]KAH7026190.1 hypothetical protein B0I36DRAFT_330072 [Microdochium trichocladiopsis]
MHPQKTMTGFVEGHFRRRFCWAVSSTTKSIQLSVKDHPGKALKLLGTSGKTWTESMPPKQASSTQRRIKITASKQIRNRSRRQRQEKAAVGNDDGGSGTDTEGGDDDAVDSAAVQDEQRHQQRLLDIFRDSFRANLEDDGFTTVLQEIKQALYEREFERAFAEPRNLEVYAARWSPTRALCYARIFDEIRDELEGMLQGTLGEPHESSDEAEDDAAAEEDQKNNTAYDDDTADAGLAAQAQNLDITNDGQVDEGDENSTAPGSLPLRLLAIGGGAAELVAFASHVSRLPADQSGHATLLDVGPWGEVVQTLHKQVTTPPVLSKYANAAAKAANAALITPAERFSSSFVHKDVLDVASSAADLQQLLAHNVGPDIQGPHSPAAEVAEQTPQSVAPLPTSTPVKTTAQPLLITLLFTLNELYTTSGIGKTTKFLRNLTAVVVPGTLLLVVDSPGSYSEASVGKEGAKKKYPMQWLLDHTLLHSSQERSRRTVKDKEKEVGVETTPLQQQKTRGVGGEEEKPQEPQSIPSSEGPAADETNEDAGGGPAREERREADEAKKVGITWEKIEEHSHDSVWFRMPEGLRYPIPLENMRYQMHMYRAV